MKAKTRGIALHISVFLVLLVFLLRPDRDGPSASRRYAWTTVNYKTTSATPTPPARGKCRGLEKSSKPVLVVARVAAEPADWLDLLAAKYHVCTFTADAPVDTSVDYGQTPENRGHEAMAYLTFLIDNYANIPKAGAVFVHGSRFSWHNDEPFYDNLLLLKDLNVSAALEPWGYHNMRCDWSAGTCVTSEKSQASIETHVRSILEPWNVRAMSDRALPRALSSIFGDRALLSSSDPSVGSDGRHLHLHRSDVLRAQCCAQFVVSRESVHRHTREEYLALRQWLLDGSHKERVSIEAFQRNSNAAPADDRIAGRVLSYVWHILFLQPQEIFVAGLSPKLGSSIDLQELNAMACPLASDCYCRLYGRCSLKLCTSPGHCSGQYILPPSYTLPEDWSKVHK